MGRGVVNRTPSLTAGSRFGGQFEWSPKSNGLSLNTIHGTKLVGERLSAMCWHFLVSAMSWHSSLSLK
jgi:hypothetical protein